MSVIEVKVPELSESVSEATLIEWKKKPGEAVTSGEVLVEVETDKIILEIPAPATGVLVNISQPDGADVQSGQLIAVIDDSVVVAPEVEEKVEPVPAPPIQAATQATGPFVMPAAARILADANIDPATIAAAGTRVTKQDAQAAVAKSKQSEVTPQPTVTAPPSSTNGRLEQRVPMSRLRARVAERLVQSQQNAAILTTFNEVNMAPVMALRAKYKEAFEKKNGVKLGFMSFFVKAAVHALRQYPIINASVEGSDIIYHGYFDIGVAVGSPRGLVVPVLRDADQMSFAEIELAIADFGRRAKDGKLSIEELTGGTFTISNGGVFGSLFSTPIINPPQSAILGIHATKERPVAENGQVVIRPMSYFALSYDHRIIDGREAVLALAAIKEALEDPARLLLDL